MVNLIANNGLPIRLVESSEMAALTKNISALYVLPTRRRFTYELLPARAAELRGQTMEKLMKADNYSLTVEFDGVRTGNGMSLLAVVVTTQSGYSALVDLVDVSRDKQDSELLAKIAIDAMWQSSIESTNFNCVISD